MNQAEERTESTRIESGDVVAEAIAFTKKAKELRDAAIEQLLKQREKIEQDLLSLGYSPNGNGSPPEASKETKAAESRVTELSHASPKRFKNYSLAEAGIALLREHGTLHGKEIEKLAKAGGFPGGTHNFQNYIPVAFKRAGGFENIGGNRWKLNENVPPKR